MTIQQLRYFIAVAAELNFTRAAKRFYISQTAMSLQIQSLENELGVQLLERNNRHVALTPAGRTFLDDARAILRRTEDAVERAQRADTGMTGNLAIGFVKGYEKTALSDALSEFHVQYPNIALRLVRENVGELYDMLLDGQLDYVINIMYSDKDLDEVAYQTIQYYPLLAVMPASHPLSHRASIHRTELKGYPLVDIKKDSTKYGEVEKIHRAFADAGIEPEISYVSDDIETSILAVAAGLGYALLPSYITDSLLMKDNVIAVPLIGEEQELRIVECWRKDNKNEAREKFRSLLV